MTTNFATETLNRNTAKVTAIQSQIEQLQRELSELQLHHQAIQSASQKGESAKAQFREAVAAMVTLNEPEMLTSFIQEMAAIVGEYDVTPAGHLPEVIDVEPEPATTEPEPTPPAPSETETPQPTSVGSAALDWTGDIETLATSLSFEEIKEKAESLGISKPAGHHRSKAAWIKAIREALS